MPTVPRADFRKSTDLRTTPAGAASPRTAPAAASRRHCVEARIGGGDPVPREACTRSRGTTAKGVVPHIPGQSGARRPSAKNPATRGLSRAAEWTKIKPSMVGRAFGRAPARSRRADWPQQDLAHPEARAWRGFWSGVKRQSVSRAPAFPSLRHSARKADVSWLRAQAGDAEQARDAAWCSW